MSYTPSVVLPSGNKKKEEEQEMFSPRVTISPASVETPADAPRNKETKKGHSRGRKSAAPATPVVNSTTSVEESAEAESSDKEDEQPSDDDDDSHLSGYIYLLPSSLAEEARHVQQLYFFPLEDARQQLYALAYDKTSSRSLLANQAKKVARLTYSLQNFWDRAHAYADRARGKRVEDEYLAHLENLRKKYAVQDTPKQTLHRDLGQYTKAEIELMQKGTIPLPVIGGTTVSIDAVRQARIIRNTKFLRRTDRQPSKDIAKSLSEAAAELHEWGEKITETMQKACASYGYTIPAEWIHHPQSPEERRLAKNESNRRTKKARHDALTKVSREMAADQAAEDAERWASL